ncbi:telomere repeat-binding factor 4-like isoform X2 [Salvia miltiorrhiza]|uniref:telomere repeat-binding factor 4-like isoform X2 n=1 Tax=Salvia miltiorrhiza TaxID=226208 RepID=UPI0025ABCA50|nr:telomere repeat-binding factor 4-like isoform X2 [Salvia miltiorrhiza]
MGNPKQKWTSEEEEALRAGVAKHGAGKWKNIQRDPEFNHLLFSRSNIDLKDKWRNLSVANGQGPRDKSKTPKTKASPAESPATPLPAAQTSAIVPYSQDKSADVVMLDSSKPLPEGNSAAKYNAMIFEALSTLKEPNGSDSGAIATYIEQRQEVPQNFKRALSSRLRRLVQQDKLEKVQNCYRIKNKAQLDTRIPITRPKELQPPRQVQSIGYLGNTVEEAAVSAAYKIAEAENKSFVAAEAVKEAERVSMMAEDMESLLQFASDCFDQSARGEIILMA